MFLVYVVEKFKYRGEVSSIGGRYLYFSVFEKKCREDLFDRDDELQAVLNALDRGDRFIVIKGVRRIGKSSLLNVALSESKLPYIKVDGRRLYSEFGYITRDVFYRVLESELNRLVGFRKSLLRYLGSVKGISVLGGGVVFEPSRREPYVFEILDQLNEWAGRIGEKLILAFDEAHYFRFSVIRLQELIASSLDRHEYLYFILTGSEVGLLEEFLGFKDYESPLYGRYRVEIYLDRFTLEVSRRFLIEGFSQYNLNVSEEFIDKIIEVFDGLVGWLSYFGYWYATQGSIVKDLDIVFKKFLEEASGVVLNEISHLLKYSPRYRFILKAIARGYTRWSEIYRFLLLNGVKIGRPRYNIL